MKVDARAAFGLLVIVTPNFNLAATVGFLDPFRASNYLDGSILFRWDLASAAGGEIIASNGISVRTRALRDVRNQPQDMVIVSSSWAPETYNSAPLHSALLRWARAGVTLGAIDTGAFILAEAGLLKGKRATTHYEHIDSLRELYVDTETSEDLFVYDGNRITCCGGTAATDFALHIIRSMHGDSLANAAARYLFHQSLRSQGTSQNPSSVEPLGSTAPSVLKQAIKLMEDNLEDALTIPQICKRIRLSQRQLDRLFAQFVKKVLCFTTATSVSIGRAALSRKPICGCRRSRSLPASRARRISVGPTGNDLDLRPGQIGSREECLSSSVPGRCTGRSV